MIRADYIQHMGTDLTVVNAARVSFDKESEWETITDTVWEDHPFFGGIPFEFEKKVLTERDAKLIRYLADHNHWTPFSHAQITLREEVPIFVARQRFKHMVGFTYNEVSRRYVDDKPRFYTPNVFRGRAKNKKQGSTDAPVEVMKLTDSKNRRRKFYIREEYKRFYRKARAFYHELLEAGVCPEQARMVLPQSMMTSYYVTGSLAAFARAYKLRIDPHAQKEIQDLAKEWDRLIRPLYPEAWSALVD